MDRVSAPRRRTPARPRTVSAFALTLAALPLGLLATGCSGGGTRGAASAIDSTVHWTTTSGAQRTYTPPIPVSHPPFDSPSVTWMERLDQPYVYMDVYGSYALTGSNIPMALREAQAQGLDIQGPPFCLFYDDPAEVPAAELRARVCLPLAGPKSPKLPLAYDVLPHRTVSHMFVSGPYPEAPRAYRHVYDFIRTINKVPNGPILERYFVPPNAATAPRDLLCEIQIPFTHAPE